MSSCLLMEERLGSLLAEPFDRTPWAFGVLVGVRPFPVFEVEGQFREGVERVLGLWLLLGNQVVVIFRFGFLCLWLLLFLRLLSRSGSQLILLLRILRWRIPESFLWSFDVPELGNSRQVELGFDKVDN